MLAHVTPDARVHREKHPNTDPTQTYQKNNDDPTIVPESNHVASPLDEPAPTDGKPFGQPKHQS